jgi:5S rRNA maturation endonuclease (ribonuclease M5)
LNYKFRKLLTWLGADDNTVKRLVIDAIRIRELVEPERVETVKEDVVFRPRPLPEQAQTLQALHTFYEPSNNNTSVPREFHDAVIYSANRHIDLVRYNCYWTPEQAYNLHKRLIIPFTWRNEVIGYTARAIYDDVKPKYYSQYDTDYVYNVDRQRPTSKFVIVVEGPLDAMAIDGVAILGNECSEVQADIIDSLAREVIVVPDCDRAGIKLIDAAIEYGWHVSFPIWQESHKDVASAVEQYGKLFTIKSILAGRETSKLKIKLLSKRMLDK